MLILQNIVLFYFMLSLISSLPSYICYINGFTAGHEGQHLWTCQSWGCVCPTKRISFSEAVE